MHTNSIINSFTHSFTSDKECKINVNVMLCYSVLYEVPKVTRCAVANQTKISTGKKFQRLCAIVFTGFEFLFGELHKANTSFEKRSTGGRLQIR